jgi:hypothetical protein
MQKISSDIKLCPFCAEPIQIAAKKCKHCGSKTASMSGFGKGALLVVAVLVLAFCSLFLMESRNGAAERQLAQDNIATAMENAQKAVDNLNRTSPRR